MEKDNLVKSSEMLLHQVEERADSYPQEFYPKLAQMGSAGKEEQDVICETAKQEAQEMRDASAHLKRAYWSAMTAADELETRLREGQKSGRKKLLFRAPPANSVIDFEEKSRNFFARGLNFYKIALIIIVGSFLGVVVELLWCLITNGYLESRSGLVYGPFNLLYGVGAFALTLALYRFRNRSSIWSFAGGMIVGSVVEYVCSWVQELVFGSVSWDYSHLPFNLDGRICLLYSVFWGVLGVFWVKKIYPRFAQLILKIPNLPGRIITIALTVFLIFNGVVSFFAVERWSERRDGQPAANAAEEFLDEHFPDSRMEKIYANMQFTE